MRAAWNSSYFCSQLFVCSVVRYNFLAELHYKLGIFAHPHFIVGSIPSPSPPKTNSTLTPLVDLSTLVKLFDSLFPIS